MTEVQNFKKKKAQGSNASELFDILALYKSDYYYYYYNARSVFSQVVNGKG